jgi:hypothetical protein
VSQSPFAKVEIDRIAAWPKPLSRVRDYWLEKRGKCAMPSRSDISPRELKAELPSILLADVVENGADFRYRLVGTHLREFFYSEPSGKLMSEALLPFGEATVSATLQTYRNVMERRNPMRITGSGSLYGQEPKHFDALLAPLSDDGETVNMILGSFIFVWDHLHKFRPPLAPVLNEAKI